MPGHTSIRKKKRKQKNQDRTCVNRTWLELEAGTNCVTISGWIGRTQMEMCGGGGGEGGKFYFTTKRLHDQYMVSSGQYRWIYCPLVPEGSIKFSVMPSGMKLRFSHELLYQFS